MDVCMGQVRGKQCIKKKQAGEELRKVGRIAERSMQSVPSSIRSHFVTTPIVRTRRGSTSRATFSASLFAILHRRYDGKDDRIAIAT